MGKLYMCRKTAGENDFFWKNERGMQNQNISIQASSIWYNKQDQGDKAWVRKQLREGSQGPRKMVIKSQNEGCIQRPRQR